MPGSRDKDSRNLIAQLKETLRIHFKGVDTFPLDATIPATDVTFDLTLVPYVYGGAFFTEDRVSHPVVLEFEPCMRNFPLLILGQIQGEHAMMEAPEVHCIPPLNAQALLPAVVALLPGSVPALTTDFEPLVPKPALGVGSGQLKMDRTKQVRGVQTEKFKKPLVYRFPRIAATAVPLSVNKNPLPIQRAPIPPTRFSMKNRKLFRELLAQKAKLPVIDVQLVGVYDRIFLGLYQSLTQTEDGTLLCTPRLSSDPATRRKDQTPVYLIIGKSLTVPGKSFQVILPMADLKND